MVKFSASKPSALFVPAAHLTSARRNRLRLKILLASAIVALSVLSLSPVVIHTKSMQTSEVRGGLTPCPAAPQVFGALPACSRSLDLSHKVLHASNDRSQEALCKTYRHVCFDQERVISFDGAYSPANTTSVRIPRLNITSIEYSWSGAPDQQNGDRYVNGTSHYEPITFRPAGSLEPGDDLRDPVFNNCTVPLIMWTPWPHNYEEVLSHVFSRLWQLQHDGAMDNNTLLIMGTPNGENPRAFIPTLLQVFTTLEPSLTFAELSARRPTHRYGRCFSTANLCLMGGHGYFAGMYNAARQAYLHYEPRLPPPPYQPFDSGPDVLKVLIEHREGLTRRLLNWAELEKECNAFTAWKFNQTLVTNGTAIKQIQCRAATFNGDPLHNFAVVGHADVLVAAHGSGDANWLAMREGSAMLELRPYKFGSDYRQWSDWYYPEIGDKIGHKVFWYALNIESEAASEKSQREKDGFNPDAARYSRDRHIILPFSALQEMLQRIAAAGHSLEAYMKQRSQKQHYVQLMPNNALVPV